MSVRKIWGLGAVAAAALLATSASAANLVVNGSFETGDFSGWTANAVSYPMFLVTSPVEDGTYAAQIAGYHYGPDTLTQNIADVSGQHYQLSFWRYQDPGTPNGFDVTWNGSTVHSETDNSAGAGWQNFTVTVTGHGTDALVFAAYNDPALTYVDNISVTGANGVPEPATWAMMLLGFGGLGAMLRRRAALAA
jgi:hypothetical protein